MKRFLRPLQSLMLFGSILAVAAVTASCGQQPTAPSASQMRIVPAHRVVDGVVRWDPNDEPYLALTVDNLVTPSDADRVVWHHDGWQVDDSRWRGADLRVNINTPGCGYGGYSFVITAETADSGQSASVTVWMEPYICAGSPWLTE